MDGRHSVIITPKESSDIVGDRRWGKKKETQVEEKVPLDTEVLIQVQVLP